MKISPDMSISTEDFVTLVYKAVLGRKPENKGMNAHLSRHNEHSVNAEWMFGTLRALLTSSEFLLLMQRKCFEQKLFVEHSQHGEAEIILRELIQMGIGVSGAARYIVDVGASGKEISNSFDLLKHFDIKGVLIEANPDRCNVLRQDFDGLDVDVINAAVSDTEKDVVLWVSSENTHIASIRHQRIEDWRKRENFSALEVDKEFKMRSRRLHHILHECNVPLDFFLLSIDIEGEDFNCLKDLLENSDYRPFLLIAEGGLDSFKIKVPSLLDQYCLIASTSSNSIFKRISN